MTDDGEYGTEDGWPPLGQTIPDDPYDEDGYCEWCGNGKWKDHGLECAWADARDDQPDPILDIIRLAGTFHKPEADDPVRIEMNDPGVIIAMFAEQPHRGPGLPDGKLTPLLIGVPVTANPDIPPGRFEVIHYDGTRTFHPFNQDTAP